MERIWGFDIGTTSIGFAVIELDGEKQTGSILHEGARIFPEGRTEKELEPRNQARRAARLVRRQHRRRRLQRRLLRDALADAMMQYSVYQRHCASWENAQVHIGRMGDVVPPKGEVRFLVITDHQFGKILTFRGKKRAPEPPMPTQLEFF